LSQSEHTRPHPDTDFLYVLRVGMDFRPFPAKGTVVARELMNRRTRVQNPLRYLLSLLSDAVRTFETARVN